MTTPKEIRDFLRNESQDVWYGHVLEGVLDVYQDDMSVEEINRLIKEEVKEIQYGYNEYCERN